MHLLFTWSRLTKPRITILVVMTTVTGYLLAGNASFRDPRLLFLVAGTVSACSGAAVLNQYLERTFDARMRHTRDRPIPAGSVKPVQALIFGIVLVLAGVALTSLKVNLLSAFLILLSAFLYIVIYTPMKRVSWLSTSLGAVAGALPPVTGWAAATGSIGPGAWMLFLILFVWQHQHFYAIAWMYREDYTTAGFRMLSVVDTSGSRIFRHILISTLLLIPVSFFPYLSGLSGIWYGAGALTLGTIPLILSVRLYFSRTDRDTRRVFKTTLVYLPALLILIILDSFR